MDGVVQSRQRKGNQKAVVKELFPRLKKMLHGNMKTNSLLQWDELPTIGLYSIYTYVLHFGIFLQGKKKTFQLYSIYVQQGKLCIGIVQNLTKLGQTCYAFSWGSLSGEFRNK